MTTPIGPEPPDWYDAPRRAIWQRCVTDILVNTNNTNISIERLDALVGHITRYQRAQQLAATSDILINRDGIPVDNPVLKVLATEEQAVQKLRREFGLTKKTLPDIPLTSTSDGQKPIGGQGEGRWCDQHNRRECTSLRSNRETCHGIAVKGFPRCKKHLGYAIDDPVVIVAQLERNNPLAGRPMNITPMQALVWRVRVLAGEVARLDAKVQSLEGDDLVFGVTSVEEKEDYGDSPERTVRRETQLNQWILLRAQRERMLHEACQAALRAGIQEQVVDLLKQEAVMMAKLLVKALGLFDIPEDDPRIPVVIPEMIRELTA